VTKPIFPSVGIWSVLNNKLFRILWITNVIAFIATWIHEVSVSWLMTSLTLSPFIVSLVQTAMNFPFFLLSLPAGALADILDRKRLIIATRILMMAGSLGLAILSFLNLVTPATILLCTFLISLGASIHSPAWQAIIPELVNEKDLPNAITSGSVGFNLARIIGPALGGIIIGLVGPGITFLLNAFFFSTILTTLSSWKTKPIVRTLPTERFIGALKSGIRYTRNAPHVKAVLIQIGLFSFFASALLSFIPLIARARLGLGPFGFGLLYGCFGIGGLLGATLIPRIRKVISINVLVISGRLFFGITIACLSLLDHFYSVGLMLFIGGFIWLILISTYNIAIQTVIPSWVRGRIVSVYMLAFFGSMACGSAIWGFTATIFGIPGTLQLASVFIIIGILVTYRLKISGGEGIDFSPYKYQYWPDHTANETESILDEGPVLIQVEYCITPEKTDEFLETMRTLKSIRLRNGAFRWDLFRDVADTRYFVESFVVDSWAEHLRQHERCTVTEYAVIEKVRSFHSDRRSLEFRHFLAEPICKKNIITK
jgi:MFS family permease